MRTLMKQHETLKNDQKVSTISFDECMEREVHIRELNGKHHDPISVKRVWCTDQVHYHGYHTSQ